MTVSESTTNAQSTPTPFPVWTREQLLVIAHSNPEALVDIILQMQDYMHCELQRMSERIRVLEAQLAQNSRNSSKPPSSDGPHKPAPKSLREPSTRLTGGQVGHTGNTLSAVEHPDEIVTHTVQQCPCGCGSVLGTDDIIRYEARQVFDIPPHRLIVTEHRSAVYRCSRCGNEVHAPFPEWVTAPTQYGPRMLAFLVYLRTQHLIPLERIRQLCTDLYRQDISEATIPAAMMTAHTLLAPFEDSLRETLRAAPLLHADETGIRVKGKTQWLHSISTEKFTLYEVHPKRGTDAIEAIDILPHFRGRLIHDCFSSYFTLSCRHGLCNAHILRELTFIAEELHEPWADAMRTLLREMYRYVHYEKEQGKTTSSSYARTKWSTRYHALLNEGYAAQPPPSPRRGTRGRIKRTKAQNLLDRLTRYERSVLAFLYDYSVPFTNNQAEQDIRMMKVQQKISGTFRSFEGAHLFARVRSYLSTVRKHQLNVFDAVCDIFVARPFIPSLS